MERKVRQDPSILIIPIKGAVRVSYMGDVAEKPLTGMQLLHLALRFIHAAAETLRETAT